MPAGRRLSNGVPAGRLDGAPWFDIDHYREIPQWSRSDWYLAISGRLFIDSFVHQVPLARWDSLAVDCIRGRYHYRYSASRLTDGIARRSWQFGPVAGIEDLEQESVERLSERLSDPEFRLVAIDLTGPDRDIKAAFANWLRKQRWEGKAVRQVMTDDDIRLWTECRVIPYIDIELFRKSTGSDFRPVDIQNALFGDAEAVATMVRDPKHVFEQSTKVHAKKLLSRDYFRLIAPEFRDLPAE